jgi:hypothetical protein
MLENLESTPKAAADAPQPAPTLTPEQVVEQLRALRAQIPDVTPLTPAQRAFLRNRSAVSPPVVEASINVIGVSDVITLAVGQPAGVVRVLAADATRWSAVEDELRGMLNGVAGGNLTRRQQIALFASQAYAIGRELARVPQNAVLVPHVTEIKRLKKLERRPKRTSKAPEPSPAPVTAKAADAPEASKA